MRWKLVGKEANHEGGGGFGGGGKHSSKTGAINIEHSGNQRETRTSNSALEGVGRCGVGKREKKNQIRQ